jgi:hypothetical protein
MDMDQRDREPRLTCDGMRVRNQARTGEPDTLCQRRCRESDPSEQGRIPASVLSSTTPPPEDSDEGRDVSGQRSQTVV